ncbi:MAG TPA: glycosyltransferase family 39 protein [Candidatus Saccharimonadales bacterium]|nr:glycosyltransferase family 39 protein [Candidatus Saccharimonadales bacterium]
MAVSKAIHKKKISPYVISLASLILLGIFLRFFNTPTRYSIDGDSIRDALVGYQGAKTFSFPLIGPFSSTGPYTFGSWYYISIIIFFLLLPLPYSPWILMGITSVVTILVMADIGRLLHSQKLAIILAFLTAIAPSQVTTATSLSNINPIPFFAALTLWIVLKYIKKEFHHWIWYLLLGIVLGLGINDHYQMIGLLCLPIFLWFIKGWKKYTIPLLIGSGIFVTLIPLLIFNLETHWHTVRGIEVMIAARQRTYVANSWKIYLVQFWPSHLQYIFSSSLLVNIVLVLSCFTVFLISFIKKRISSELLLIFLTFVINFILLRYYWGERHDVYVLYITPILFIFLGYVLVTLWDTKYIGKLLFLTISAIISWNMLQNDYSSITHASRNESISWQKEFVMISNRYPHNNIVLYSCSSYYEAHKRYLVYLLNFSYQPSVKEKMLGMKEYECNYPLTKELDVNFGDYNIEQQHKIAVYPPLFSQMKETNFNFIDLSPATPSAIQKAGWTMISTKDVFEKTVNWWH